MKYRYADIHSHILPGVDDGAKDIGVTRQLLEAAWREGIRRLFLTPHFISGRNIYRPGDLDVLFHQIKEESMQRFPDLELYLGNEVLWSSRVCEHLRRGDIHTMNGTRYVLVEFHVHTARQEILHAAEDILESGFWPVIAHVERYGDLIRHPEDVEELTRMGAYLQMNTRTVSGKKPGSFTKTCHEMIERGWISFFGTDAHNMTSRPPEYKKAARWILRHIAYADELLWRNAGCLITGEIL